MDAFFAIGPVFKTAAQSIFILTKAKKNIVAYLEPEKNKKKENKAGRPAMYGEKIILMELFDNKLYKFTTMKTLLYNQIETIRCLTIDLLWKPIKSKLRFFLIESNFGRMILMR